MPISYAVLLDGGFIRRKLGTGKSPVDASLIGEFVDRITQLPCLGGMRLHRVYFYDAEPLNAVATIPLGGGTIDFGRSAVAVRSKRVQAALITKPFLALRLGELFHEGWRLKRQVLQKEGPRIEIGSDDFQPDIRQKGVDMRIGLDIASLTLKRQVQVVVLVTADSDFVPAMKFARREGAQLFLITLGHGIRDGLREHADLVIESFPPVGGAGSRLGSSPVEIESISS
jgi:uncharacterized LabA/DUF88 family protein